MATGKRRFDALWILSPLILAPLAAICVAAVGNRVGFAALALEPEQASFWTTLFTGVGGTVGLAAAMLAAVRYLREAGRAAEAAVIEANKPFVERQQSVYYELVSVTALIGNREADDAERRVANDKFWELYWGAVPMVADLTVGAAVNRFSEALDNPNDMVTLRNCSMQLAMACRDSLGFVRAEN